MQIGISVIILFTSGLPIVFKQTRIGKKNKPFVMYKFRTMRAGAEDQQKIYKKQNEADGPVFKIRNDPRFTRFGRFLSHTGLDELPQLWNVLKGDMSIIGPRPLPKGEADKLSHWQQERHKIKPGIVSPWILNGYHSRPFSEWMKSDIEYVKKKCFRYDVILFCRMIFYISKLFLFESFHL